MAPSSRLGHYQAGRNGQVLSYDLPARSYKKFKTHMAIPSYICTGSLLHTYQERLRDMAR